MSDPVYRNVAAMPIQQIGELTKRLTDDFLSSHAEIPWKQIKGMRTWLAHQYMGMDQEVIWEVMHEGIPQLRDFCEGVLKPGDVE